MTATLTPHCSPERESQNFAPCLDILIAEDNIDGAETLAHILEQAGHNVRVVYDGQSAVAAAVSDPPDVALMDIGLPRIDGWEAARRIRAALSGRPCLMIAISGYDRPADRRKSFEAGFHCHYPKPVDPGRLLDKLERYHPPTWPSDSCG